MKIPQTSFLRTFGYLVLLTIGSSGSLTPPALARVLVPIVSQSPGSTPFIVNVTVDIRAGATLDAMYYTIDPRAGSKTRPIFVSYSGKYLAREGFQNGTALTIPVPFLYAGSANTVHFVFFFTTRKGFDYGVVDDTILTAAYTDPCNRLNTPLLQQNRISTTDLGYDFFLLKNYCSVDFPAILDTDANIRWVGTSKIPSQSAIVADNGLYTSDGASGVIRTEFDGRFRKLADYATSNEVTFTGHHNYDQGRDGIILEVNTTTQTQSVDLEINSQTGAVLNRWDLAVIISNAMIAGGDDPAKFVQSGSIDWFHNNSTTYSKVDNTLIVSSRENFVIAVDYDTPADGIKKIHWILGDPTKLWHQFPSLQQLAMTLEQGTSAPIGQHSLSFDHNHNLMLFDDGQNSQFQRPAGLQRSYSAARIYTIDPSARVANEIFTYAPQAKQSLFCGSFYEAGPGSYLVDYTVLNNGATTELLGLGASQNVVFDLQVPTASYCGAGWNAIPLPGFLLQY